jgi:hypothetical protein
MDTPDSAPTPAADDTPAVLLACSQPDELGATVICWYASTLTVSVAFTDGSSAPLPVAGLPTFVLQGLSLQARREAGVDGALDPADAVDAGVIVLDGPTPLFVYAHPPSGEVVEFGWDDAGPLVSAAVVAMLEAGVAQDVAAAEMPDDAAELSDDPR